VGITVAQNGVLSRIIFVTSSREVFSNFTIVDDAPPYDIVPKQLFNSDLLCALTNSNNMLQFPAGVQLDGNVAFGNLTIAACPKNAVFTLEATGALPLSAVQTFQRIRDERKALPPPLPPPPMPPHGYWKPWEPALETPPQPPKTLAFPEAEAMRLVEDEARARQQAKGIPTIVGPSYEQRRFELSILYAIQVGG
jgi:hypothetical protein